MQSGRMATARNVNKLVEFRFKPHVLIKQNHNIPNPNQTKHSNLIEARVRISERMNQQIRSIVRRLYECEALKFGQFKLKSGIISPIYIDLRVVISHADLKNDLCTALWQVVEPLQYELLCGVPYTALVFADTVATLFKQPMVMRRKEAKAYGTGKSIDGLYTPGQTVLVIEDLISSGASIMETVLSLRAAGLKVNDAVVFIDRQQGGVDNLKQYDINVHSVVTVTEILEYLKEETCITSEQVDSTLAWVRSNPCPLTTVVKNQLELDDDTGGKILSYPERAILANVHPLNRRLFELMERKQSNLVVAADLTQSEDILSLASTIGGQIVALKLHVDIVEDFNADFVAKLTKLADEHEFLLFEDRKFADIGNTVQLQYGHGVYKIVDWAHLVTAHISPGPGLVRALSQTAQLKQPNSPRGCLLIAQMSSEGNLLPADNGQNAYKMANDHRDYALGFISQRRITRDPAFIHMTPGVRISESGDELGQQYISPEQAIEKSGADVIIVGRGIVSRFAEGAGPLKKVAEEYRRRGYDAYLNTL